MRIAVRIWVVVGFTVALATWTTMTALVRGPAWLVSLPVVGTVWLLVCMDVGYLLGRNLAHRRRRQSSQPRRDVWTPDPAVRRPIDFPLVLPRPTDDDPVDHQGRFRATGVRLAVLPALAVVFLTVQTVFLDRGSHLGIGFVLAECLLLVWMVWTVWTEQEPSRPWVTSRVRAELFRREMFLLLASVGPYLGRSGQQAEQVRDARLARLAAADLAGLAVFARLADHAADGTERDWRDEVWRQWYRGSGSMGATASAGLTDLMRTYLDYRIRRQSLYFELAADKCERTEQKLGAVAKASVLGAVAMAVVYAALLIADNGRGGPSATAAVVALLAAGLPPLCNTVLAVQNLFASQRLATSYRETRQELLEHESALRALLADPPRADLAPSFGALVVRVEETLTEEVRRWRITVAKPEFEAGL
ncbi:hypothetical protein [Streptomyces sp. NBC_00343]|uniref:hypothetical protein n=1 Tax=Streptomyces sp. NBC_00343 TaxID=2975719 RepID=UPI002E2861E1|nr:hypothetical protein [Streptomyces sp. NBC_00343]